MERYTVAIAPYGKREKIRLLVPFLSTASVSAFVDEIKQRIARLTSWSSLAESAEILLHLEENGPLLDGYDTLSDAVLDPRTETIHVSISPAPRDKPSQAVDSAPVPEIQRASEEELSEEGVFRIRVITPSLARAHKDPSSIPVVPSIVTNRTTLRDLRARIAQHIHSSPIHEHQEGNRECNCSFARQIANRRANTYSNIESTDNDIVTGTASPILTVISGKSRVESLAIEDTNKVTVYSKLRERFGDDIERQKAVNYDGGVDTSDAYSVLPVVSICSQKRHMGYQYLQSRDDANDEEEGCEQSRVSDKGYFLDLHTSECYIGTTNYNLTVGFIGLESLVVNGILNIYTVWRSSSDSDYDVETGKDAIFKTGDHWHPADRQSERAMAMFLSSLRVFSDLIKKRDMQPPAQDAVLHMFDLLTRFPPALRSIHILMHGKSPGRAECAALAQSVYEVLNEVVPKRLIGSDSGRVFEGSRLLFGLILEKAKHVKLSDEAEHPYLSSLKSFDLTNSKTMEPIENPVMTSGGLMEAGYVEAYRPGGALFGDSAGQTLLPIPLDTLTKRLVLLNGGLVSEVTFFDLDALHTAYSYKDAGDPAKVVGPQEISDVYHLSALCERNKLVVLPPSALPSSQPPALTLDRDGFLAVFTGRQGCAAPGRDIAIFRATRGGEHLVDVSIITQLLEPILKEHEADGTSVFDSFGGSQTRKFGVPDEILILCVDCSASMSEKSDFVDIIDGHESAPALSDMSVPESTVEDNVPPAMSLDEVKEMLLEHEAFQDMVGIVCEAAQPIRHRRLATDKVLEILNGLLSWELSHWLSELESLKQKATRGYLQQMAEDCEAKTSRIKNFVRGIQTHKAAISDFLIFRAANRVTLEESWAWTIGEAVPTGQESAFSANSLIEGFFIPHEFRCPISHELLEDPVIASDTFTYERSAINQWFQIRQSSPLTGLELRNTTLRSNRQLSNEVNAWIHGADIVTVHEGDARPSKRARSSSGSAGPFGITFFGSMGSFNRQILPSFTLNDLYRVAYRGQRGRRTDFRLHLDNVYLMPSEESVLSVNLQNNSRVHIDFGDKPSNGTTQAEAAPELCLIKVYTSYDEVLFSYWTHKRTDHTLASIVFHYWRFTLKHDPRHTICDMQVWTDMEHHGDGQYWGITSSHWERLSTYFTPAHATGRLQAEKLCSMDKADRSDEGGDSSDDNDNGATTDDSDGDVEDDARALQKHTVLKVHLSKGRHKAKAEISLTRLDVLKQMFDAFVNRVLAYNYKTHMGLVVFETSAKVSQPLTPVVENFRHRVNTMEAKGDTALWDALALADDQLTEYSQKFPAAKKRIMCLSDGADTKSLKRSHEVGSSLVRKGVVVDSFCIGEEDNADLRTISYLTGGYKFVPRTLDQAMAIVELEPVLSQHERPPIVRPSGLSASLANMLPSFVRARREAVPEVVTRDVFPKRKEHPNLHDQFVELTSSNGRTRGNARAASAIADRSDSTLRSSRLLLEMNATVAAANPNYDVYVSESDMAFWIAIVEAPPESPYAGGTFALYLHMDEQYPAFAPNARFTTRIHHPNVNRHGRICHSLFDRNWTSDTTVPQVLQTVYGLLLIPELSDPVNAVMTLGRDPAAFRDEVRQSVEKHAKKTRTQWRTELVESAV